MPTDAVATKLIPYRQDDTEYDDAKVHRLLRNATSLFFYRELTPRYMAVVVDRRHGPPPCRLGGRIGVRRIASPSGQRPGIE